ncbi:MAG: HAD-IA family hydrolase [Bacteroidales bacterium]|nr:HAD-IA family hydrolase [Bacteroidales bacterium]
MYIIFDFDGTLADTFALGSKLINEYADRLGYKQIDFAANKDKSARELIKMSGVRFWQIPGLIRFFRKKSVERAGEVKAFDGIPDLVRRLHDRGFLLGIITTNSAQTINIFLEKYGLTDFFTYIKPEISLFGKRRALRRARRHLKTDIIYIGDELRDIEACRAVDIPIISVAWGFNSTEILEKNNTGMVAEDTEEVYNFFFNHGKH